MHRERVCTKKNSGGRYDRKSIHTLLFFFLFTRLLLLRTLLIRNYTTTSFGCILSFPLFFLLLFFLNLFIVVLSCARQNWLNVTVKLFMPKRRRKYTQQNVFFLCVFFSFDFWALVTLTPIWSRCQCKRKTVCLVRLAPVIDLTARLAQLDNHQNSFSSRNNF